jgi:hypothetical protein
MATTYIGFYQPHPTSPAADVWRNTGKFPPEFAKKVNEFPTSLPPTCKLIGSWVVSGGAARSVLVIEAESFADIQHVNQYYNGWLEFDWHPTTSPPRDN